MYYIYSSGYTLTLYLLKIVTLPPTFFTHCSPATSSQSSFRPISLALLRCWSSIHRFFLTMHILSLLLLFFLLIAIIPINKKSCLLISMSPTQLLAEAPNLHTQWSCEYIHLGQIYPELGQYTGPGLTASFFLSSPPPKST